MLRLTTLCYDLVNKSNHLLVHFVSRKNRFEHHFFRHLVRSGLNHNDLFFCGRDSQLHIGYRFFFGRRIKDKLSIY